METARKLEILADAAKYDASCASNGGEKRSSRVAKGIGSVTGGNLSKLHAGWSMRVAAENSAHELLHLRLPLLHQPRFEYVQRARFTPEEVVQLTLDFYRRNYIEGLFLSSGIIRNPDYTMEQVVAVARTLRVEHEFRGYIHLKTIPEAARR